MDDRNEGRGQPYQDVLAWLRTATVEEIRGALAISWGLSRDDLERGIRSMMRSDRPTLANEFPKLRSALISLQSVAPQPWRIQGFACPLRGTAVVNQAPTKSAPGLGPAGFHPHVSGPWPARSACRSFRPTPARAQLPSAGSGRPNGLSAASPCLQGAFAAYPRSRAPCGIPRPLARGLSLDSPGLPRPTDGCRADPPSRG
jgi:hypothetical protein